MFKEKEGKAGKLVESDEEDEKEDFIWLNEKDPDNYFILCTREKNAFAKDDQVFICYGKRPNNYLLQSYGFTMSHNKYNSMHFKVVIDFDQKIGEKPKEVDEGEENDNIIRKAIILKKGKLTEALLAYIRMGIIEK